MKKALSLLLLVWSAFAFAQAQTDPALAQASRSRGAQAIRLTVDATEVPRKLFHSQLVIPAAQGPLTLYYPQWIPGEHGPTGPIINLAGLKMTANGKTLQWQRDAVDMYAFHVEVPAGAKEIEVALDYLAPTFAGGFSAGSSTTSHLAIVTWNQLVLYPQGYNSDDLMFTASLRLPDGWKFGTSLPVAKQTRERVDFAPVSLTTLIDSPVLAGDNYRAIPLSASGPAVELDLAADSAAALNASPQFITAMKKLVPEAAALFGAQHYERYNFLLTLSDRVAHFGLEHHQSNDSRVMERSLIDETLGRLALGVVSHEYVHSWNGKYRRPAGLATPDFQQPMKGELLWVYEGLTQYLGNVLAARSGIWTAEEYREHLAQIAANLDHRPGRLSRPLIDTAIGAQIFYNAPNEWSAARRGTDFYDEGWLIWLDADTLIRQQTGGKRSLDDFCRRFHGAPSGAPTVKTYTFDDVVSTLNEVAPYDWRKFLNDRLYTTDLHAPLEGITRGGWRLVYDNARNQYLKDLEEGRNSVEMGYSIGLRLGTNGTIGDVIPATPAARAGLGPGMTIVSINGRQWSPSVLRDEVSASKLRQGPISLLVNNEGAIRTYTLDYHGGEQYPHLERDPSKPDLLGQIIAPRTGTP
ncbi:MAG: M61 family peptidase [Acidobacteria bacterium]|nr:M61 family peptidase [Acidobacteriota bacterium]